VAFAEGLRAVRRRGPHTSGRTRTVLVLLGAGLALLLVPAALAQVEPLVLAAATPADRAVVPPTPTGGVPWRVTVTGPPPGADVAVTVSTSPALGPDGVTLATDDRADFFFLSEHPSTPRTYTGLSDPGPNAWSATAATYFWQVTATWTEASGVFHSAASEIRRLVIGTPPPAPPPSAPAPSPSSARTTLAMNALDATYYVRTLIRRRTGRAPQALRYGCARLSSRSFRCRPRWRDSRNVYSATATLTHGRTGRRIVARATLSGLRASRRCVRSRSVRSCGRRFRWRAVSATRPRRPSG
jgi:hypothetical protein